MVFAPADWYTPYFSSCMGWRTAHTGIPTTTPARTPAALLGQSESVDVEGACLGDWVVEFDWAVDGDVTGEAASLAAVVSLLPVASAWAAPPPASITRTTNILLTR